MQLLGFPQGRRSGSTSFPFFNVFGFVSLQGVPEETLGNSQEKLQESTSAYWDSFRDQRSRLESNLQTTARDGRGVC